MKNVEQPSRKIQAMTLSLAKGLNIFISVAIAALMARVFSKNDVALYNKIFLSFTVFLPLLELGISQAMFYFLPVEQIRVLGRVYDGILLLFIAALAYSAFLLLGGNVLLANLFDSDELVTMVFWMIPYAMFMVPVSHHAAVLVVRKKVRLAAILTIANQAFIGFATLSTLYICRDIEATLVARVISTSIFAFFTLVLLMRVTPIGTGASLESMREMLCYSIPLALATVIGVLHRQLDKLIVSANASAEEFAVFITGAQEIPLVGIITGSIVAVTIADMRKIYMDGKIEEVVSLFRRIAEKSSYIIFPVMLFFIVNAEGFVILVYGESYKDAAIPLLIYTVLLPIRCILYGSILAMIGMGKWIVKRSLITLFLNTLLSIYMVSLMGPNGAAVSTVVIIICYVVPANYLCIAKKLQVPWFTLTPWGNWLKTMLILFPMVILGLIIKYHGMENSPVVVFFINSSVFGLYTFFFLSYKGVIPIEKIMRRGR